jgi:arylsulfatase A-like enzyme
MLVLCVEFAAGAVSGERPNVLVVICDDLNDTIEGMGGHPQAKTPNIDRLCRSGVRFLNAHSANPVCGPSRASLWTGLYPHTTGIYGHNQNNFTWRDSPVLRDAVSVFEHFQANGYTTYASGKIFHNNHHTVPLFRQRNKFDRFGAPASFGPFPWDGKARFGFDVHHPSMKRPWGANGFETFAPLSDVPHVPPNPSKGTPGFDGWYDRGRLFRYESANDRDLMVDELSVEWFAQRMQEDRQSPFFITVGFLRPHCPWIVPQKYFDMFPLEDIQFPPYLENDMGDCAGVMAELKKTSSWHQRFERLQEAYAGDEGWRRWIQGYLACVAFVDNQLGGVLDALEASSYAENTIIVFSSDHGFHMGEKDLLCKKTVWEESTRVPLVIGAPGVAEPGGTCSHPVSLVDLYPTLIDLCGLPKEPNAEGNGRKLDGHSLRPFLADPTAETWNGPSVALSCIEGGDPVEIGMIAIPERQHFTVRGKRYRYALWNTGEEELYDHENDPHEWQNLAGRPEHAEVQTRLRKILMEMSRD